jgi:L-arabinose isomerase
MSTGKDPSGGCFFKTVKVVWNMPEKKGRRRPRYVIDETIEEEKLWVVRYIYKSDLAASPESGHALFRASDEEQACNKLTTWLHLVRHQEAIIESVELLPSHALKRLSVQQARKARRQAV